MAIFSDKKQFIRVSVDGVDVVCVVKRNTTSSDVIKMVMVNRSSTESFALFESSFGIEQRVPDDTRISKLVKSWGEDKYKFSLVLRQIDHVMENKIAASANQAKTRLRIFRALLGKKKKTFNRSNTTILSNLDRSDLSFHEKPPHKRMREFVSHSHLSCSQLSSPAMDISFKTDVRPSLPNRNQDLGKHELMKRYMIDVNQFYVDDMGLRRRKSDTGSVSRGSQSECCYRYRK